MEEKQKNNSVNLYQGAIGKNIASINPQSDWKYWSIELDDGSSLRVDRINGGDAIGMYWANVQAHPTAAEAAAPENGEAADPQRQLAETAGGSSGAASCSGIASLREADPSEVVILPIWNDDKPFFCAGLTDLASIGSLFIQYYPNWEDKIREFLVLAQKDGFIGEDDQDIRFRPVRSSSFSDTIG